MTSFKLVLQEVTELRLSLGVLILECMASLLVISTCQLDHIWNQLKPKQLGTLVGDFLDQFIGSGKIHHKSGSFKVGRPDLNPGHPF